MAEKKPVSVMPRSAMLEQLLVAHNLLGEWLHMHCPPGEMCGSELHQRTKVFLARMEKNGVRRRHHG